MQKLILTTIFIISFVFNLCAADIRPERFVYHTGDTVFFITEKTHTGKKIALKNISVKGEPEVTEIDAGSSWIIPAETSCGAIGIYEKDPLSGKSSYVSYFRIVNDSMLTTYEIEKESYKGVDVYTLDGGMSAEYAVQKSLSNLTASVSHTWKIGNGGGPTPVWGTPDFLIRSAQKTVDLYNENLGSHKPVETVIISTGVPVIPYLSAVLDAVVLPLHFLVSVNSIKEVQSILEYSSAMGSPSYATLGYDASMADVGVAWIKFLKLPDTYLQFIKNHQVKNVIFLGVGENVQSESFCRKVKGSGTGDQHYTDGSLYILYTQSGSDFDIQSISAYIKDYNPGNLEKGEMLSDWESGIVQPQLDAFVQDIQKKTDAKAYSLVSPSDMSDMYDLATDISLEYLKKNKIKLQGVMFNEYLISQPKYELLNGKIPLLYWQFTPASVTVDRLDNYIVPAASRYFPKVNLRKRSVHLNARIGKYELETELKQRGYRYVSKRLDNVEEVWDLSDGINAPCEFVVSEISKQQASKFKKKMNSLTPLTISDLRKLTNNSKGLSLNTYE